MLQNKPKKRKIKKSQPVHKRNTGFPTEKVVSEYLVKCVKDSLLTLMKRINILKLRCGSQLDEKQTEDNSKNEDTESKKQKPNVDNKNILKKGKLPIISFIDIENDIIAEAIVRTKKKKKTKKVRKEKKKNTKKSSLEDKETSTASLLAIQEEIDKQTTGTTKKIGRKKISSRKNSYRILVKKFIEEYKYYCRLGELVTTSYAISYRTTLRWMKRAGICDNNAVTFRDVEVHFISSLKKGYKLKILDFICFLNSLCADRALKMSTVLIKLLSCREVNLVTRMMPVNSIRNSIRTYNLKSTGTIKTNFKFNQAVCTRMKTNKKFEGKYVLSNESQFFSLKRRITPKDRAIYKERTIPYLNSFENHLYLDKKPINLSSSTDSFKEEICTWKNMKKSDDYSKEKINRNLDAEFCRGTKKQEIVIRGTKRKPHRSNNQFKTQPDVLKVIAEAIESASTEENYDYVESDSSFDKVCNKLENMSEFSQHSEQFETRKCASNLEKKDFSKILTAKKANKQFQCAENNLAENTSQMNKCMSTEHINLNTKLTESSYCLPNELDVLKISQNKKTESAIDISPKKHVNRSFSKNAYKVEENISGSCLISESQNIKDLINLTNKASNSTSNEEVTFHETFKIDYPKEYEETSDFDTKQSQNNKIEDASKNFLISLKTNKILSKGRRNIDKSDFCNDFRLKSQTNICFSESKNQIVNLLKAEKVNFSETIEMNNKKPEKSSRFKDKIDSKLMKYSPDVTNNSKESILSNSLKKKVSQTEMPENMSSDESDLVHNEHATHNSNLLYLENDKKILPQNKLSKKSHFHVSKQLQSNKKLNKNLNKSKEVIRDLKNRKSKNKENKKGNLNSLNSNFTKMHKHNLTQNKNTIASNLKKNTASVKSSKNLKIASQKNCKRYHALAPSKALHENKEINFSSVQKNKSSNKKTKSVNNLRKICSNKSLPSLTVIERSTIEKSNIPLKNKRRSKFVKEEQSTINSFEDGEHVKTMESPSSHIAENEKIFLLTDREKAKILQKERFIFIPPRSTKNTKFLDEKFPMLKIKTTDNSNMSKELENIRGENHKIVKGKYSSTISPKNAESLQTQEENFFAISSKNTVCEEAFEETNLRQLQTLDECLPLILSKSTANDNVFEENYSTSLTENIESSQILEEERFFVATSKSIKNEKVLKEKVAADASSNCTENEKIFTEKKSVLGEDRIEPHSRKARKKAEIRTFTNLPIHRVQKHLFRSKETKPKVPKLDKINKHKEITDKSQQLSSDGKTFDYRLSIGNTEHIACLSKDRNRPKDMIKLTINPHKKVAEKQ